MHEGTRLNAVSKCEAACSQLFEIMYNDAMSTWAL